MMMSIRSGLLCAAIISATLLTVIPADALQRDPRQRIDPIAREHDVSVAVAARGKTLYEHAAGEERTPASVQKVLLTMALFDELGPGHRSTTRVESAKSGGAVGNLWAVGGGDPSMVSGTGDHTHTGVGRLANRIHDAGIRRVRRSVIVDSSLFSNDWHAPGWQAWSHDFATRPMALAVDGNGSPDPALAFGSSLTDALETRGIAVGHDPRTGRVPARARVVARVRSAPLRVLVTHMNTTSSNSYAEMLGKLLGSRTFGPPGTIAKGARAIEGFAEQHGVELTAHDSSGLSYANRVSAHDLVVLLDNARQQPWGQALRLSLPSPGEGTIVSRLEGVPLHAKTGTLWNGSSALAGWVRLRRGGVAAFAILAHGTGKSIEDAIVNRITTELKAPKGQASNCQLGSSRADTRCHLEHWWKEIGPPARTPE